MATSTVEDYVKCILLEEQVQTTELVSMGQIAAALRVAPGTVTSMVKTLADSGLASYEPYSGVRLTSAGRQLALHVLRRHRLVELFLVQVMGIDWSEVHAEAELLEHSVSDLLIDRMDEMLGSPQVDPHGDPIPTSQGEVSQTQATSLLRCQIGTKVRVVRVTDQHPDFLQLVERESLKPGSWLKVESRSEAADTVLVVRAKRDELSLGFRAASKIMVSGD